MFIKIFLKYYCVSVERRLFTVTRMNILNSISPGECRSIPAAECWVLGVICCWIVARLEHYQVDVNLEHGTWGNEQSRAEMRGAQNREQVTPQPSHHLHIYAGRVDNTQDSFAIANLARLFRLLLRYTDRDRGSTEPLFRSRIWMILFRPFAEFAFF